MKEPQQPRIPLRLSLDEAMILMVGVRLLSEMVEAIEINGQPQEILIGQLLSKLSSVLPDDLLEMSGEIVEDILEANEAAEDEEDDDEAFDEDEGPEEGAERPEFGSPMYAIDRTLPLLEKAIATQQAVDVEYYSLSREEVKQQRINPYALRRLGNLHWLVAYCHTRQANRIFRVDRIKAIEITPEHFDRPETMDVFDLHGEDD